jgi:hypothetical protein
MAPEQARDATLVSPASDIFSLGATLLYAATGHPPYRGETVMDILVRLATEEPDLENLPDELAGLVTGCLKRVPRDRPTGAAILAELGPHVFPAGAGHIPYLPDSAMALIAEYQRGPVGHDPGRREAADGETAGSDAADIDTAGSDTAGDADDGPGSWATDGSGYLAANDSTSGSHTPLPGFEAPDAAAAANFRARQPQRRDKAGGGSRFLARTGWAGVAAASVVLLAAGAGLGIALDRPGGPAAGPRATASTAKTSTSCTTPVARKTPDLCVSQPFGDSDTVFVIHGNGFAPFTPVTISLVGVGRSRDRPMTDLQGSFNYAIDQGHYFFRGLIPPGTYSVLVTGSGGGSATISFTVHPPAPSPPPSESPPPGFPPGPPPSGFPSEPPPSGQAAPA